MFQFHSKHQHKSIIRNIQIQLIDGENAYHISMWAFESRKNFTENSQTTFRKFAEIRG